MARAGPRGVEGRVASVECRAGKLCRKGLEAMPAGAAGAGRPWQGQGYTALCCCGARLLDFRGEISSAGGLLGDGGATTCTRKPLLVLGSHGWSHETITGPRKPRFVLGSHNLS